MRRPARGDDCESDVIRKSFVYGHFLKSKLREVAAFCMNKYRTCGNCGTELTQACSPSVLLYQASLWKNSPPHLPKGGGRR